MPNNESSKSMTQENQREDLERDQQFFSELEKVLDEQFPKVEEEGLEKQEMRRGAALVLFGMANVLHSRRLYQMQRETAQRIWEMAEKIKENSAIEFRKAREMKSAHDYFNGEQAALSDLQEKIKKEFKI